MTPDYMPAVIYLWVLGEESIVIIVLYIIRKISNFCTIIEKYVRNISTVMPGLPNDIAIVIYLWFHAGGCVQSKVDSSCSVIKINIVATSSTISKLFI